MKHVVRAAERQDGLVTRAQARDAGLTEGVLRHLLREDGRWQRVTTQVLATFTGSLTRHQQMRAGLLHAGSGSVLGGATAVELHGVRYRVEDPRVHVLAPHQRRPRSNGAVVVRRTHDLPTGHLRDGLLCAPLARAAVDATRSLPDVRTVRALLAEVVQSGRASVEQLERELERGPSAGSRLARAAVAELREGVRSVTEAELRELYGRSSVLPVLLWNPTVYLGDELLGVPDGFFVDVGLAVESQSYAFHGGIDAYERTMLRKAVWQRAGVPVLDVTPRRHRHDPASALADAERAYLAARRNTPYPVCA